ncbi:hypothetical protein C3744_25020 [Priestia megaterium]|uniref:YetF C-terminal domain-containing protein n=1 Tax=Priestia megaterium TaxID=1404 RepID=A0A3D8WW36_PRIMG|nr:DUF421 domain-containing protein [Priestia megaterium]MDH3174615.1 DUF421 domain-containing protein [Priestia megaterium]RDZ09219.1 hypothetical protein C3744_25020 [Priestia megaterium]
MDLFEISWRTIVLYGIITVVFRFMGQRGISQLNVIDLVVVLMISELAVVAIEDSEKNLLYQLVPIFILMLIEIILAYIQLKSQKLRRILDGEPVFIIKKGKIDNKQMQKHRYNLDDLLLQLRDKGIGDIQDVDYAILEPSGTLSVLEKSERKGSTSVFLLPLITDGVIQEKHLELLNKNELWLHQSLKERGYEDVTHILYCSYLNGQFFIDIKKE